MDENQVTFHLALNDTRTRSPPIYHAYKDPLIFRKLMRLIYSPLILPQDYVPKDFTDYKLWREFELLRRIDNSDKIRSNKPDYMEEDLTQIIERRDDLLFRIDRQTKHIKDNRSRILDMQRTLSQYWKMHMGPFVSFKDQNLIFETLLKDKGLYISTKLTTIPDTSINTKQISSFFNISQFSPELLDEFDKLIISDNINISSIKEAVVKEKVASNHDIDFSWYKTIRIIQIIKFLNEHFREEIKTVHLELSAIQMHDILDKTLNTGTSNELFLKIEKKSDFKTYLRGNILHIHHPNVKEKFRSKIDKRAFSLFSEILDETQTYNLYLHPLFIWLNLKKSGFEIDLISPIIDFFIPRSELMIKSILHHKPKNNNLNMFNHSYQDLLEIVRLDDPGETYRFSILDLLFNDQLGFNFQLFEKDVQVQDLILDQHLESFIWFDFIKSDIRFKIIDSGIILEVEYENWQAKLIVNEFHSITEFNCSCSKSNKLCSHLEVLLIYYNEGLFI